ncbi:MarR family transcriptional regulator [Paenibacillus sp. M1]|uniref:MarR family transcriptional regulator n=1 Tax=Paenibacillus haidiansis TaxID=1574488 RepID=A0ABU7VPR8_9BACL
MDQNESMQEIVESFRELRKSYYRLLADQADRSGISVTQYLALRAIRNQPGIGMGQLAGAIRLENSTVSGLVDRLAKAGLVERERREHDRRSIALHLTEMGREVEHQTKLKINRSLHHVLELPRHDIDHLLETHRKIIEIIEKVREGNQL